MIPSAKAEAPNNVSFEAKDIFTWIIHYCR